MTIEAEERDYMPKEKKYVLEMNEEQALMTMRALEFYARMGIGQWNMVGENFLDLTDEAYCEKKKDLDHRMEKSRRIVFPDLPHTLAASLGIRAVDKAALAWELYTVIRHRIVWTNNPEGGYGCHFDEPISFSGRELAKCDVVYSENGELVVKER